MEGKYGGEDRRIGKYLETLQRPDELSEQEFQTFRKKALSFLVRDGHLYKRGRKHDFPHRRVIGINRQRLEILTELHNQTGRRGRQVTYDHVSRRYQWKGM